jgi:hypothetical protein
MRQLSVLLTLITVMTAMLSAPVTVQAQSQSTAPVLRKKPVPEPSQFDAGCTWIGNKILMSIIREDIVAANEMTTLYERFDCPKVHLRQSFDCAVTGSVPEKPELVTARITACWLDPVTAATAASSTTLPNPTPATPAKTPTAPAAPASAKAK